MSLLFCQSKDFRVIGRLSTRADVEAELERTEKHYTDQLAAGREEVQESITAHEEERAVALEAGRDDLAVQYLAAIDAFKEALEAFGVGAAEELDAALDGGDGDGD